MRLSNALCGFSLCMIFVFLLGNVTGIHINRELQNLSIESEGNIKESNFAESSGDDVNDNNNSTIKEEEGDKNNDQGLTVNNTDSGNNTITEEANDKNETISQNKTEVDNDNKDSQEYHIYNGTFDFKKTFFMDGIAYNATTGLPILPNLMDRLKNDYDFDDMPALKDVLEIEIGWIIIGTCLGLLAIMIITIIIVSVIKHGNNRARREAEE